MQLHALVGVNANGIGFGVKSSSHDDTDGSLSYGPLLQSNVYR